MLFKASEDVQKVEFDDKLIVKYYQEVETINGWIMANKLQLSDSLKCDTEICSIKKIESNNTDVIIYL